MTTRSLALFLLAALTPTLAAQQTPLRWGADADGGIPYVFADPDNPAKRIGFEKDIADALARELGRPVEFEQRKFENLLPDLDRDDIDLIMNGFEVLPERKDQCLFTKPYYVYQLQYVIARDSRTKIETVDDIKKKKVLVATLSGSSAERFLKNAEIDSKGYEDQDGPFKDLRAGVVGAVLLDLPIALYYAASDDKLEYSQQAPDFEYLGKPFAEGSYAIAVKKDAVELHKQLDDALDRLRQSGELKKILKQWGLWNDSQKRIANPDNVESVIGSMSFVKYFPLLVEGAIETVKLSVVSMALAVMLGLLIALCRLYGPAPIRWLAIGYIEFFRGIPVLLLLFFIYYGVPSLNPELKLPAFWAAVIGFGLNYAAYEAEIYRGGIGSIARGQWEAAASVGMGPIRTFFRIILPQAVRVILPPMTNDFVALFKDTSVVSIIAITELTKEYQILTRSGGYLEIGLVTAALYLIMSVPLGHLSLAYPAPLAGAGHV